MARRVSRFIAWGTTPAEHAATYPCDQFMDRRYVQLTRGVDVSAPASSVFPWICQIKVAPYSYDLFDNFARRSPRMLTPDANKLAIGQSFMVFKIASFMDNKHITGITRPKLKPYAGMQTISYTVEPRENNTSRIIVCIDISNKSLLDKCRNLILIPGDWLMMRKQLLNLKKLAEHMNP